MSSLAVWAPVFLLVVLVAFILNVARHAAVAVLRKLAQANFERRLSNWSMRRTELEALVEEVRTARGLSDGGDAVMAQAGLSAKLRRGEVLYRILPGTMVEERSRQNVPTLVGVASGAIAITDSRLLFEGGGKRREWAFGKLHTLREVGPDTSLLGVSNRKALSGIQYREPERTRMYLDLALAESRGSRASVLGEMTSRLARHKAKRPKAPSRAKRHGFSTRDRHVLIACFALLLWPVIPALIQAFDPPTEPSWWWLGAAGALAAVGIMDLLMTRRANTIESPARPLLRRGSIVSGLAVAMVIGSGFAVPASALEGTVERVVDGDTIVVRVHDRALTVRVLNIDTPETIHPTEADECLGQEASTYTEQLVPAGTRVDLKFDDERTDRYGRTLAVVNLTDGRSIATELAKAGLGIPMVVGPNDTYFSPVMDGFKQAEEEERGYFDPTIECTFPAQQAQLPQDVTAAQDVAEAGISATEAAAAVAAAATVLALYEVHNATSKLISTGAGFAIRAMKVAGATTGFAAYQATTRSLGETFHELDSLAKKRKKAEDKAKAKAEAKRKAKEKAADAAAERAERAEEERARKAEPPTGGSSGGSGSGSGSNTGDSGHPCLPGERDGDGDGWCGET